MHIVHLGKYFEPARGGMESLVRSQALSEAALGNHVDIVAINHKTGISTYSTELRLKDGCNGRVTLHRVGTYGQLAKCDLALGLRNSLRQIASTKPDIWHLHTPNATMLIALLGLQRICRPLVISHHSDILKRSMMRVAYNTLEQRIYSVADKIVSDSAAYIAGSKTLMRYARKVVTIPLGIETLEFTNPSENVLASAKRIRDTHGGPIWLCVGRLTEYKGFDVAIRALTHVGGKLFIVGTGKCESRLKALATELKVADRISWFSNCDDEQLRGLYKASDALWFPSNARNEGFGLVQVEAMASGCPVINALIPHSGVSWVSQHEMTGFSVPINDPKALAEAAQKLIDNPPLRKDFAAAAVSRATSCFDESITSKHRLREYADVLENTEALNSD
jgi:glycosyltransferase involved in cell wall biosynthesis